LENSPSYSFKGFRDIGYINTQLINGSHDEINPDMYHVRYYKRDDDDYCYEEIRNSMYTNRSESVKMKDTKAADLFALIIMHCDDFLDLSDDVRVIDNPHNEYRVYTIG
jgi:hypothetical protein